MDSPIQHKHPFPGGMEVEAQATAMKEMAETIVDAAVDSAGRDAGRTPQEQWERMGDHYEYQAVEQDPTQHQLDDYANVSDNAPNRTTNDNGDN